MKPVCMIELATLPFDRGDELIETVNQVVKTVNGQKVVVVPFDWGSLETGEGSLLMELLNKDGNPVAAAIQLINLRMEQILKSIDRPNVKAGSLVIVENGIYTLFHSWILALVPR